MSNINLNISGFVRVVKTKIIHLAKLELNNEEKKERLDEMATEYAKMIIDNLPSNFVIKWALRKAIIENIPAITQVIFDLLKAKVKEL